MERLHFFCSRCGEDVDVGIGTDVATLLRIRSQQVRGRCPECGKRHNWDVRDAQLPAAA